MNTLKIKIFLGFSRSIQRERNDSVSKVFSGNIVEYSATRDNDGRSCSLLLQWGRSLRVDAGWKERKGGTKPRGSLVRLCEIKTCFTGAAFIATSTFPFVSLSQRDYSGFQSVQRIHSLPMAFSGIPRFPFFFSFFFTSLTTSIHPFASYLQRQCRSLFLGIVFFSVPQNCSEPTPLS